MTTQAELDTAIADHELWLSTSGTTGTRMDYTDGDLQGLEMDGHNLAFAEFLRTNMRNISAVGTNFDDTDLRNARLDNGDYTNATFNRAIGAGMNFEGATLLNTTLNDIFFKSGQARNADLTNSKWIRAYMLSANLEGSIFDKTNFTNAVIQTKASTLTNTRFGFIPSTEQSV